MARRSKTGNSTDPGVKSAASMFKDSDGFTDPSLRHKQKKAEEKAKKIEQKKQEYYENIPEDSTNAFGDDPYAQPFPFNYIYATQDYLNDHMDTRKTLQLLVFMFVGQSVYQNFYDKVWANFDRIVMNYSGVLVGMFFTYNVQWKKHIENKILPQPAVPEFNLFYSVLVPNLLSLFYDDEHIFDNLSFNYFAIENSPLVVKAASSVAFYLLYGDANNLQPFLAKLFVMMALTYAIQYINTGNEEHVVSDEVVHQDIDYDLTEKKGDVLKTGFNTSLSKAEIQLISVALMNLVFHLKTDDVNLIIFQKLIVALISGFFLAFPIFQLNKLLSVPVFCAVFYYLTDYLLQPVLKQNSLAYLMDLIGAPENTQLFFSWVGVLIVSILLIFNMDFLEFNFRRKMWHLLTLATILPSYVLNPSFTELALLGLLVVLLIVESIRLNKITIIGQFIHDRLYKFQDFKDLKGPLNLSYIYLVIGVTTPIVLQKLFYNDAGHNIKSYIGIVILGVGDTLASIVGKRFGRIKYPGSNKTLLGTVTFIAANYGFFKLLEYKLDLEPVNWEVLLVANIVMGVCEGAITINDNLIIPVLTYIVWVALENGPRV